MVKIISSKKNLDISRLEAVYAGSLSSLSALQDFYMDTDGFFKEPLAYYCVWEEKDEYVSALRIEPYKDGWLVAGLETVPNQRNKGYAKALLSGVLQQMPENVTVYSHIEKGNAPSIAVHTACGFCIHLEHAVFLDGSVSEKSYTFITKTPAP